MASAQLTGEDFFVGLDRRKRDVPGRELEPVPTQPSTTAYGIAKRFGPEHLAGIEAGVGTINTTRMDLLPLPRRSTLFKVYERTKEQAAHAYTGALTLRSHIGFWAEAGNPLAAELMGGPEEPRANAVHILDRSIAGLPEGLQKIRCRWEAGYFAGALVKACLERNVDFAIAAKCAGRVMTAVAGLGRYTWTPTTGMENTEIEVNDYLPDNWPKDENIVCIKRAHPRGRGQDSLRQGPEAPHHLQAPNRPSHGRAHRRGR